VSVALDLYFRKFGHYPPPGTNLSAALGPFLKDRDVFENAIGSIDISRVYEGLDLEQLDKPENYVTGFYGDDGETMVLLKTNGKVVRKTGYSFNPKSYTSAKFAGISAVAMESSETIDTITHTEIQEGRVVKYKLNVRDETEAVSIKFEARGNQLGEDGVEEYDKFSLEVKIVDGGELAEQPVAVTVKAGTDSLVPFVPAKDENGDPVVDADGEPVGKANDDISFGDLLSVHGVDKIVPLVIPGTTKETGWAIRVTSEKKVELIVNFDVAANGDQDAALSNIEIALAGGVEILKVLPTQRFDGALQ
jgi:hypothetical protein